MALDIGTLLKDRDLGVCTVISARRTGHQYERYFEYELLTPQGTIVTTDEYEITAKKMEALKEH